MTDNFEFVNFLPDNAVKKFILKKNGTELCLKVPISKQGSVHPPPGKLSKKVSQLDVKYKRCDETDAVPNLSPLTKCLTNGDGLEHVGKNRSKSLSTQSSLTEEYPVRMRSASLELSSGHCTSSLCEQTRHELTGKLERLLGNNITPMTGSVSMDPGGPCKRDPDVPASAKLKSSVRSSGRILRNRDDRTSLLVGSGVDPVGTQKRMSQLVTALDLESHEKMPLKEKRSQSLTDEKPSLFVSSKWKSRSSSKLANFRKKLTLNFNSTELKTKSNASKTRSNPGTLNNKPKYTIVDKYTQTEIDPLGLPVLANDLSTLGLGSCSGTEQPIVITVDNSNLKYEVSEEPSPSNENRRKGGLISRIKKRRLQRKSLPEFASEVTASRKIATQSTPNESIEVIVCRSYISIGPSNCSNIQRCELGNKCSSAEITSVRFSY